MLKEAEAGAKTADLAQRHRVSEATIYNWKSKKWRAGGVRCSPPEGAGEREREAQAATSRCDAGQGGAEGPPGKKVLTPAANREAVAHLQTRHAE